MLKGTLISPDSSASSGKAACFNRDDGPLCTLLRPPGVGLGTLQHLVGLIFGAPNARESWGRPGPFCTCSAGSDGLCTRPSVARSPGWCRPGLTGLGHVGGPRHPDVLRPPPRRCKASSRPPRRRAQGRSIMGRGLRRINKIQNTKLFYIKLQYFDILFYYDCLR